MKYNYLSNAMFYDYLAVYTARIKKWRRELKSSHIFGRGFRLGDTHIPNFLNVISKIVSLKNVIISTNTYHL